MELYGSCIPTCESLHRSTTSESYLVDKSSSTIIQFLRKVILGSVKFVFIYVVNCPRSCDFGNGEGITTQGWIQELGLY